MKHSELEESNRSRVRLLQANGVKILNPESVFIGEEVNLNDIEAGVTVGPGTSILGETTLIGAGTEIKAAATIRNSMIGRNCSLHSGEYLDSVLLDGCSTVGWARVRGNSAWEEGSQCAHNVDTKTTLLAYKTTLGSLINFCNVLMLGGTSPRMEVGAEVGSGTINFNFLPFGPALGALIKPSTIIGSIESPFLSCEDAPVRYDFIGGHTSIIAPVVLGLNCVVAAKTRVNPGIYGSDVMIAGGNLERATTVDVSRIRVLKDITPKYQILVRQLATAIAFRRWFELRIEWAEKSGVDGFERRLIRGFAKKVDRFLEALEDYGDNLAKYLLASDSNSRPEQLETNKAMAKLWVEKLKPQIRGFLADHSGYAEATAGLLSELSGPPRDEPGSDRHFYGRLAKLSYSSKEVRIAREYFEGLVEGIVHSAGL